MISCIRASTRHSKEMTVGARAATLGLIVAAIGLAILLAVIVFFTPAAAHGVERLKQKISVREQWLATCSHSPRREECYLYATGFYARPLHLARTCTANSAGLLARNLGQ